MNSPFHQKANKNSNNLYKIKNQIHEKADQLRRQRGDISHGSFEHSAKTKDDKMFRCFPSEILYVANEREPHYEAKWY
jgi:hypothetical protein